MSENQLNGFLGVTMDKIKEMVDVNTVIGDPIPTQDGTTVIPISRVSYGFASGGTDLPSKAQPNKGLFAGGSGAGITITPIAFLAVKNGGVRILQIEPYFSPVDRALEKIPDVMDKLNALVQNFRGEQPSAGGAPAPGRGDPVPGVRHRPQAPSHSFAGEGRPWGD